MTREEAIRQLQSLRDHCRTMIRDEYEDGIWALDIAALDLALAALTPPNEPLTLDELLKMDGEPVYVVFRPDNSGDKPQFWALVSADKQHDEVYLLDSMGGAGSYDEIWANLQALYRRPPEGGKYEVL